MRYTHILLLVSFLTITTAQANEEAFIISTGLGIASPSFHDGMNGENPAGLSSNLTSKIVSEIRSSDHEFSEVNALGGVLLGNGYLGAGLEYEKINDSRLNWGVSGRIAPIMTTVGFAGHHKIPGTAGNYDAGILISLGGQMQIGISAFDILNAVDRIGLGIIYDIDNMLSFVADVLRDQDNGALLVCPGLALMINPSWIMSLSYAYQITDDAVSERTSGVKGGIGIQFAKPLLFKYEYNDQALHSFGLSIRF
jgi:hypothetical protein